MVRCNPESHVELKMPDAPTEPWTKGIFLKPRLNYQK